MANTLGAGGTATAGGTFDSEAVNFNPYQTTIVVILVLNLLFWFIIIVWRFCYIRKLNALIERRRAEMRGALNDSFDRETQRNPDDLIYNMPRSDFPPSYDDAIKSRPVFLPEDLEASVPTTLASTPDEIVLSTGGMSESVPNVGESVRTRYTTLTMDGRPTEEGPPSATSACRDVNNKDNNGINNDDNNRGSNNNNNNNGDLNNNNDGDVNNNSSVPELSSSSCAIEVSGPDEYDIVRIDHDRSARSVSSDQQAFGTDTNRQSASVVQVHRKPSHDTTDHDKSAVDEQSFISIVTNSIQGAGAEGAGAEGAVAMATTPTTAAAATTTTSTSLSLTSEHTGARERNDEALEMQAVSSTSMSPPPPVAKANSNLIIGGGGHLSGGPSQTVHKENPVDDSDRDSRDHGHYPSRIGRGDKARESIDTQSSAIEQVGTGSTSSSSNADCNWSSRNVPEARAGAVADIDFVNNNSNNQNNNNLTEVPASLRSGREVPPTLMSTLPESSLVPPPVPSSPLPDD